MKKFVFIMTVLLIYSVILISCNSKGDENTGKPQSETKGEPIKMSVMPIMNDNELANYSSYHSIGNESGGYERFLFTTNVPVKDFWYIEVGHNEDPFYLYMASLIEAFEISPDYPFLAIMPEVSRIPQLGISYTDENNNRRYFFISEDGEDGSHSLSEFHPQPMSSKRELHTVSMLNYVVHRCLPYHS